MATVAGSIKSLSNGVFHAKDENGNDRILKVGDTIYENDTVYGDSGNSSSSKVEILLSGSDVIVLNEGQKQLIDSSLIETAFGKEELFFTRENLDLKADEHNSDANVVSDLRDAEFKAENNKDITEEDTAEGKEEVKDETTATGEFQARDGNATDIISDLRNAQFRARTQVFEDKSAFETESKDRLSSRENTDRPDYTNPSFPSITTPPPPTPPLVVTPSIVTPTLIIGKLSIDDTSAYESEGFLIFTVSLDRSVASPVTFNYTTSPITATSNGVDYTDVSGKITIPSGSTSVTIKVPITDDYLSDNGETIKINISNVVGNANITKPEGIGTILDNPVNNPENGTPNTPTETGGYGEEDSVYAIITGAVSVNEGNTTTYTVKLVDKDGNPVIVTKETEVTIKYTNVTTQDGDTEFNNNNTIIVKIPANGSTNTFTVESIDDYLADNGEKYNVAITKVDTNEFENVVIGDKSGNNKDVTTTILDNPSTTDNPTVPTDPTNPNNPDDGINYGEEDSVYAIITGAVSVNEGNTTTYTVKLVDKDGNEVKVTNATTVTVKYTNDTTQDGDTQYNNNNTISVTIPANGSSNTFTVESLDDYLADNGEKYNVAITKVNTNEFENVVIGDKNGNNKDVTTTILDDTDNTPNNPNDGVEANHESVIIKLIACDVSGNPILEADGKTYKIVNEVNEGDNAKYMALAFEPNTTTFTTETKLSLQGGTVTVDTANGTAIGVVSQTKEDGTQDFVIVDDKVVNVGVVFEVETLDDYISDNNETYTVSINSGSYTHPTTPLYENVNINTQAVTTTIKDNSNPINDSTPHDPNDTTNHNQESDKEIVLIKLFAADENGNVLKDGNGNYLLANEAEEGTSANYIAYAFENGTTIFNDSTKLSVQTGTVDISFQNNTATGVSTKTLTDGTQDFNNTPKTSINIGQSFSTEIFKDLVAESTEKYTVTIDNNSYSGNYESVNIDTNPVTTTIHDEKVFVKIEAITDTANEGGNLKYKVSIVNRDGEEIKVPTGKTITVNLDYEGNTSKEATENTDYTPVTSVTIIAETSYTEFEIITKDDYYAEGDEGLKIIINNIDNSSNAFENIASHTISNGATSDKVTTTGTIKDNPAKIDQPDTSTTPDEPTNGSYGEEDTVYAIITGPTDVNEGDTTTSYTIKLVDKDGNPVIVTKETEVTIKYTNVTTQDGDTEFNNNNTIIVKIPANGSTNTFTVESIDDYLADNGEKYNVAITKVNTNEFENVVIGDKNGNNKDVTTTILDDTDNTPNNPNDGVEANHESVIIKLIACDVSGNPILEADGKTYKIVNEVNEGDNAKYMALAFEPNTTTFTTETKLSLQGGTVTVDTANGTAIGVVSQTKEDGTQDFVIVDDKVVNVGVVFEVETLDDYISDNNETYTVSINSGSYTHPTTPLYENVNINTQAVTTTIKDNSNPINDSTPHDPNDTTNHNQESDKEIVLVKLFAADENGNVLKDGSGNYLLANEAEEGTSANYIAYAFENGTTIFNDSTKLSVQTGTVNISFQNDTAIGTPTKTLTDGTQDFNNTPKTSVSIGQSFSTEVFKDLVAESEEYYKIIIDNNSYSGNYESVNIDTNPVTTTIHDEKVFVKIEAITDTANEGGNLKYKVSIVNRDGEEIKVPTGKTITVNLDYEGNTSKEATINSDYTPVTSVTIIAETSYTEFEIITKDDYYAEGDEGLKIIINNIDNSSNAFENIASHTISNGATSDKVTTTGTIKDNPSKIDQPDTSTTPDEPTNGSYGEEDTVYAIITGPTDVNEGDTTTSYTIKLVDKDGNPVIVTKETEVTIKYTNVTTQDGDTEFNNNNTIIVKIPANGSTNTFTVESIDDYLADNGEKYNVAITKVDTNEFENVVIGDKSGNNKDVTTTILDNPSTTDNPTVPTDPTNPNNPDDGINYGEEDSVYAIITGAVSVNEGNTTTYTVKLVDKDGNEVKVTNATTVTVKYTNDTTQDGDTQYNNNNTISVTIPANGSSNTFTVESLDDYLADNGEKYNVAITKVNTNEFENVVIGDKSGNNKDVTTTIHDNSNSGTETNVDSVKIVLVAVSSLTTTIADITNPDGTLNIDNTNETPEGGNLYYIAVAVDSTGKPLATQGGTVTINYGITTDDGNDKDATAGTDYANNLISTTVGTVFSVNAKDDYYAEGNENFTVKITNLTGSPYESPSIDTSNDTVISTIKDNPAKIEQPDTGTGNDNPTDGNYGKDDTVYVKITETPSTIEGGNLVHTVTLVDKNGDPVTVPAGQTVTVNLTYSAKTGSFTESDLSTIVKSVTIVGGTNHTDFTNVTKDDFTSEGDEVYNVTISSVTQSGAFENVAIKADEKTTTGTIKDGVTLGIPVNTTVYEDGLNTSVTSENSLTNSLGITNPNSDTYTVSFDKTITSCPNTSNGKAITYSYNTDGTILTATRADSEVVFTVELKKDGSGNDVYDFKLKTVMDHEYGNNGKNTFDMPFKFNVTSNGTTSTNQTFNVTVVDSVPSATPIIVDTKEDTAIIVRLADDDFKVGETVTINGTAHNIGTSGIAIYEQGDTTKQIGSLTINSNGTVTFTPIEDYSNHDTTKSPEFTYTVKDFDGDEASSTVTINVKPVADTITITPSTPTMTEDDGNTKEGTHQVALGLTKPTLSKDQTDKNFAAGDHAERNGEITLTFTNGDDVTGAKVFKSDGTTPVGSEITSENQTLKVVIVDGSGNVDYNFHHANVTTGQADTLYLTQTEYESLIIRHAEDNDTDIKIDISVTSYELDDDNKPLSTTDADLYETATSAMTVKIHPATDDISLIWDTATGGTISADSKTFTFTGTKEEGYYFNNPIDLDAILSNTSGGLFGTGGTKADLDGSEKRTYTVSGIPEGTVITVGTQTAVANGSGIATLVFNNTNNTAADPEFSMKLPEHYSGTVNGTIKLSVQDKGVDSGDTAGVIKTAEVYFNVVVTPVADISTIQVSQAVGGYEDAGRDGGNTIAKDGTINANGTGGIPLAIKVSSDDKDGSETFDVTISAIPTDAVIYYNGVLQAQIGNSITITNFDNAKSLVIIPPHNSDADFTLNVSAKTNDGASVSAPTVTTIDVIVKNVADAPVGTDLNTNINVNEDNQLNLKSIYTHPENLASYDDSEVLTVKIELPTGFTIASGSLFYIENGMYVVKASDISAGNIKLNVPTNFSGSADLKLTYVTTEKAGENDSKTWDKQTVNIFVNPIADDVSVATSSTIYEDNQGGNGNKINLVPTLTDTDGNGIETIEGVKFLASEVPTGFKLYTDANMITELTPTNVSGTNYYVLSQTQWENGIYALNTTSNDADKNDNFTLNIIYTIKDTNGSKTDTKDFTHTHTVNVQAVTDAPSLSVGTITQTSGDVVITGTNVSVTTENSQFKVPVTTTSPDTDGSETVQQIVISGVPMGVEVVGATYYGYSGSEHNGIWVITAPADNILDANGALQDITFKVNQGANFESRYITITTYTKDIDAEVKSASQTIHIERTYLDGVNPGTPADLDLTVQAANITEDTEFNLAEALVVGGTDENGGAVITISDIPDGSTITGYDYSYEEGGKTYYVVVGNGNAADMNTKLSNVLITTPKDMNSDQVGALKGDFTFTANIATYYNGGFNKGNTVSSTQTILPLTDAMTVAIDANNINEDGTSNLSITLSNPNDGVKTELIGNSITIKVTENWADVASGGGIKGTLTDSSGKYNITDNGDGTYTITPKSGQPAFAVDTPITGLVYTSATNRDGNVNFEVSVQNKETGSNVTLDSKGSTTISVTPVIDVVLNASVVTATGIEDTAVTVGSTTLANPVKLVITSGTFSDGSEKLGNIILDEVPNGFTVWYKVGSDLVMATNIGQSGSNTFDLTPNISGDGDVHRNKWLIPASADGSMPEVYINAPSNWSGDFDFITKFTISEENLSTSTPIEVNVTGHINAVADGVTIDPTMTFGNAYSWVSLNLNANMKDTDGSETMSLELSGLDESAQFRYSDGTVISSVSWDGSKWTIEGIAFDQINNIELLHDKSVSNVSITAKTVDIDGTNSSESLVVNDSFDLKLSDVSGNFTLEKGVSLNFDNIDSLSSNDTLKNINTIDLSQSGENKLENITLQDILDMTDSSNTLKITGTSEDKVSFKNDGNTWSKTAGVGADTGFDVYTNSADNTVQVKVEQEIQHI